VEGKGKERRGEDIGRRGWRGKVETAEVCFIGFVGMDACISYTFIPCKNFF